MRTFLPDTPFSQRGDSLPLPIQIEFPVKISNLQYTAVWTLEKLGWTDGSAHASIPTYVSPSFHPSLIRGRGVVFR